MICLTVGSKAVNIYSQILTSKYLWLALFKQYLFKSYVPNLKELKNNLITFIFVSWAQYNHLLCIHIYHLLRIHPGMLCFFYRGKKRVHKTTITYLPLPTQPNRALEAYLYQHTDALHLPVQSYLWFPATSGIKSVWKHDLTFSKRELSMAFSYITAI